MKPKLKNNYYIKRFFNNLFLFIIILNASCGKQAFFSTARYPKRPPSPMAPPISSGSSFAINNTQSYSLNAMPYFSIGKYMKDMSLVANTGPLGMTHRASDIGANTPRFVAGFGSSSTSFLDPSTVNTQSLGMTDYSF